MPTTTLKTSDEVPASSKSPIKQMDHSRSIHSQTMRSQNLSHKQRVSSLVHPTPQSPQPHHHLPMYPSHDQPHQLTMSTHFRHSLSQDRITKPPRLSHTPSFVGLVHSDVTSSSGPVHDADNQHPAVARLPPILQVEKHAVTTVATQAASASRRRKEATFQCPVPGCGVTFTRRFNLNGHMRSHTSERPYICEWPECGRGFARQHDCKRHYKLHSAKPGLHVCQGCGRSFSRSDALNRHLRSESGAECKLRYQEMNVRADGSSSVNIPSESYADETSDIPDEESTPSSSRAPSVS